MSLLHLLGYLAILVIIVVCRLCSWAGLLIAFLLWQLAKLLPVLWELVLSEEDSSSVPAQFHFFCLKCVISSTTGSYLQFLVGNKGNGSNVHCFVLTTRKEDFHTWHWLFLLDSLWLWGSGVVVIPSSIPSFKLSMCAHIYLCNCR